MTGPDAMEQWVVYQLEPDVFCVRRWVIWRWGLAPDEGPLLYVSDIDAARRMVPRGTVVLHRSPEDDPSIVEVWI